MIDDALEEMMDVLVERVVERIVEGVRPEKVILFGSRARGDGNAESDIDLVVVHPGPESKRELELRIRRLFAAQGFSMDLLVLTPEEFREMQGVANSAARIAAREGVVCYG